MNRTEFLNNLQNDVKDKGPNAQHMVEVLQSGDAKQGEELANNILASYGVTKEAAINMAKQRINPAVLKMFGF